MCASSHGGVNFVTNSAHDIYKIASREQWEDASRRGAFTGSPDDVRDGFIHLSTRDQLDGTLRKHFAGQRDLVLIEVNAALVADNLRWEPSRGGQLFPHIYGVLPVAAVTRFRPLSLDENGQVIIPEDLA